MNMIRQLTQDYYKRSLEKYGDTPKGVDWRDAASQQLRFAQLVEGLSCDSPFSILDVGCGTGALLDFLYRQGAKDFQYQGIDFVPGMIETALRKYGAIDEVRFLSSDLSEVTGQYDFVVSSGIFNVKHSVDEGDWKSHFTTTLTSMFEHAAKAMVFNCLTSHVDFRRGNLFYSDPAEMLRFCQRQFSRCVRINHAYPLYEYTMTVYREEFIRA